MKITGPSASSANLFRPALSSCLKGEMGKPKRLFLQLNIILPWSGARKEEIQFSLSTSAFRFLDDIFTRNQKLQKQEKPIETNTSQNRTLSKEDIVEYYVFSVSLEGIVKSPLFKSWVKVCINKLLVCFFIHNFVVCCIFLVLNQSSRGPDL